MSIEILNKPSIKDWIIEKLAARKASGGGVFSLVLSDEKLKDLEETEEDLKSLGFIYYNHTRWKGVGNFVTFSGPSL